MNWLTSILIAVLTGILGLFGAGFVAGAYTEWYHVSQREGAAGFFVIFMALFGGIAAFFIGLITSRLIANSGFWKGMGASSGIILGIAGFTALALYLLADIPPTIEGDKLYLDVEIRLPVGHEKPAGERNRFTLGSSVNHTQRASEEGDLKINDARLEGDRWIVPAEVLLFTTRGQRTITANLGEEEIAGFIVPLPSRPDHRYEQWSEWGPRPPAGSPPWPDTKSSYRFRVRRIPPPPPPPTAEEIAAKDEADAQAEFDAIKPDAPIQAWFEYTEPWANEKRRAAAAQRITGKPTFVAEINALMLAGDTAEPASRQAASALFFVSRMDPPSADLIPGVTAAGRDIISRIRKFNASTPEQDPDYIGAADVSIRFNAWLEAVRTLRQKCGGDFIPELKEMLELSRVRTDSYCMQTDIRRVASYHLQLWAGIAPLPGDPPPN